MKKTKVALMAMACSAMLSATLVEEIPVHATEIVAVQEESEATEQTKEEVEVNGNSCGVNAKWTYYEATGTLTITGTGAIQQDSLWNGFNIKYVKIGEGITTIGRRAFSGMESIQEVTLPNSLKTIDVSAFNYCSNLTTINFPMGLQKIEGQAFYACSKLKQANLPDSVKSVGRQAFEACRSLSKVTLSKDMTTISSYTFEGCSKLSSISIPSNIKVIGAGSFSNTGLKTITIPSTVGSVQSSAFSYCTALEKANYSCSMVPDRLFDGSYNLKTITWSGKVRKIGSEAFYNTGFTEFTIPSTVTSVGTRAFSYCRNLKTLTISKNVEEIPQEIVSYSKKLQTVKIEDGVKRIGTDAFDNAYMRYIQIPASVNSIGNGAFRNASQLRSIKIPSKVKTIKKETFMDCKRLTSITFRKGVTKIGESAFENCKGLKTVSIPGNVKKIDYKAFYNAGLKKLIIGNGVQTIEYWAFQNCDSLKSVSISQSVSKIQNNAFVECDKLSSINVCNGNKTYASANGVLYNKAKTKLLCCPAGKKGTFQIPSGVSKVNAYAFYKCNKIKAFSVAAGNGSFRSFDGVLYNYNKTELISCPSGKTGVVRVPEGVKKIRDYGFQNSSASRITLPSTLESIGYCAFEYSDKLKKIVIPGNVKKVNSAAFWGCSELYEVEFESGVNRINSNVFNECYKLRVVRVPISVNYISKTAFCNPYNLTFYCKKSSYAMSYASRNYISYKLI